MCLGVSFVLISAFFWVSFWAFSLWKQVAKKKSKRLKKCYNVCVCDFSAFVTKTVQKITHGFQHTTDTYFQKKCKKKKKFKQAIV